MKGRSWAECLHLFIATPLAGCFKPPLVSSLWLTYATWLKELIVSSSKMLLLISWDPTIYPAIFIHRFPGLHPRQYPMWFQDKKNNKKKCMPCSLLFILFKFKMLNICPMIWIKCCEIPPESTHTNDLIRTGWSNPSQLPPTRYPFEALPPP